MLLDRIKQKIGFVRLHNPLVVRDNGYECAAWWEERTSEIGVFTVTLYKHHYSNTFHARASIPAKVTNDYFPALWGGVSISNKPYVPKHIGENRVVCHSYNLVDAILATGLSPSSDIDWYIDPDVWKDVVLHKKEVLELAYQDLIGKYWDQYKEGDDQYHSHLGMVGYMGQILKEASKDIENISRHIGYLVGASDMWRNLHAQNTSWILPYKE